MLYFSKTFYKYLKLIIFYNFNYKKNFSRKTKKI
uniref:Uncharacterized protein n=1 Tax=viral metagenome TaxID=1070528 RepID=A0A6C0AFC2_9ZZZZ